MKFFWLGLALLFTATTWAAPPNVSSRAWVVIDQASGRELAASQADLPLAPASLTQLMTAYVLLGDIRKNKLSLGEMVTVPAAAVVSVKGRDAVWVVRNGRAEQMVVTVGVRGQGLVQIVSGVQPGQQVIVRGTDQVRQGERVS